MPSIGQLAVCTSSNMPAKNKIHLYISRGDHRAVGGACQLQIAAQEQKPPQKLPETGVKRKRSSIDAGVPSLAHKMLKMGAAQTRGWSNPIGKRGTAKSAK